jgi:ribonuclease Z
VDEAILDHDIACLGYAIKERFSVNIRREILQEMGFLPGPWLYAFKQALYAESDPDSLFEIPAQYAPKNAQTRFSIGELTDRLAVVTKGHKIAYITDAAGHEQNTEKMISLAMDADHLFIEAAFLDEDRNLARRKKHLTAASAGRIAARAGARRFTLFHFSPRYSENRDRVEQEARKVWKTAGTGEPFNRFPSR